jgi:hypothetical protein
MRAAACMTASGVNRGMAGPHLWLGDDAADHPLTSQCVEYRLVELEEHDSPSGSPRADCYNTATASISMRNSGAASAVTATSVCAGIFFPKNSSRIGP